MSLERFCGRCKYAYYVLEGDDRLVFYCRKKKPYTSLSSYYDCAYFKLSGIFKLRKHLYKE